MSLFQLIEDEAYRPQLVSASAVDFLHGALDFDMLPLGWVRPQRFMPLQRRGLGSVQAWHPGLYRQMAQTSAGICLEFETDSSEIALEFRVAPLWRGVRKLVDAAAAQQVNFDAISCEVDGQWCEPSWGSVRRLVWEDRAALDAQVKAASASEHSSTDSSESDGEQPKNTRPAQASRIVSFDLRFDTHMRDAHMATLPGFGTTHQVRLWLPCYHTTEIRQLFGNGSFFKPVASRPLLWVMGDAATQGLAAGDPGHTWAARLARERGWDLLNQGIIGQVFQPGVAAQLASEAPSLAAVVVAFGESLRHERALRDEVARALHTCLQEIALNWPKIPCFVLTPFWHSEENFPTHAQSPFAELASLLEASVASFDQMMLVDGHALMENRSRALGGSSGLPAEASHKTIARRLGAYFDAH